MCTFSFMKVSHPDLHVEVNDPEETRIPKLLKFIVLTEIAIVVYLIF